ncbi:MAG: 4Fe-4S binding protein, partial [Niameybacter sp.]
FYNKTKNYSHKLKINSPSCIGCGVCVRLCPMQNLSIVNQKAEQHNKCTMCYRCISHCPQQAITLLGNKLYEQCTLEKYL